MQTQRPTLLPESHVISLAAAGDLQAFNDLVLQYQDVVYNLACAILGDRDAAQDATQETFISAFQHVRGFRGGSFRGWLLRIATNTCYDVFRSRRRHPSTSLYPEDEHGNEIDNASWLVDPRPSPHAQLERDELASTLYRRLDELPGAYRSAITLIDVHGLDYTEAAEALGVPLGTVKSRLARARLRMRAALSREFDDRPEPMPRTLIHRREPCAS